MQSEKEVVENQFSTCGMPKNLAEYILAASIAHSFKFRSS